MQILYIDKNRFYKIKLTFSLSLLKSSYPIEDMPRWYCRLLGIRWHGENMAKKPGYTCYKKGGENPTQKKVRQSRAKKIAAEKTTAKVAAQAAKPEKYTNYWDN